MLWNASAINGYEIDARDGQIGTVGDLLAEDAGWTVRWLVIETGTLLAGRKVLLPLSALGHPDPKLRRIPVNLTMRQVQESPDVGADLPVSRQSESRFETYYGHGSGTAPAETGAGDPNLRSITAVTGYYIHATDGDIGHTEDFLIDDAGWSIRYIIVDTKNWWAGEKVLISPRSVRQINWQDKLITLDVSRQKVKDSPPYEPTRTVDGDYDEKFYTYYGIKFTRKTDTLGYEAP